MEKADVSPDESVSVAVINVVEIAAEVETLKLNARVQVVVGITVSLPR